MPILVVDDTPAMAEIITAVAKRAGFENVDQVGSGGEAKHSLESGSYGLVISDLEMEDVGGLELLKWVRAREEMRHVRFIMITAHKRHDYVYAASNGGADCFIVKPFSPLKLKERIRAVCAASPG
jgi:two-component system chemotaxis response regulator CheY